MNTGIYVTCTNGTGINYTTGTGFLVGDVYASNADLNFYAGTGNVYPFGAVFGPPSASRIFGRQSTEIIAGATPIRTSVNPILAVSIAIETSIAAARPIPPATQ